MAKRFSYLLLCGAALLPLACMRPPELLQGGPFIPVSVAQAQQGKVAGERVRWGGKIVSVEPGKGQTCMEVVSLPLDEQARPLRSDQSEGRFLACAGQFLDPAVYSAGREVTVIGSLQPPEVRKIGDYEYRYPKVLAERIYLWPERQPPREIYYAPWGDPFWDPFWGPPRFRYWPYWY